MSLSNLIYIKHNTQFLILSSPSHFSNTSFAFPERRIRPKSLYKSAHKYTFKHKTCQNRYDILRSKN